MTVGGVDGFVAQLSRELPGPRRLRRQLLGELRDGLWDAVAAHRKAGLAPREAERRAVLECGTVPDLAREYRVELSAVCGRRTGALLAISMLAGVFAWSLVVWPDSAPASGVVLMLSDVVDLAGLLGGMASAASVVLLVWAARWWPGSGRPDTAVRSVNGFLLAAGVIANLVVLGGSVTMNLSRPSSALDLATSSAPLAALCFGSVLLAGVQVWALYRTARTTFGGPHRPGRAGYVRDVKGNS